MGLAERAGDRVGGFSKGMQQRLGLAVALVAQPDLAVLDEPTSALDPLGRADVRDIVLALKARGVAVLLNSHLIGEVERVCDRVVILDRGRVAASGTLAELLGQRELRLHLDDLSAGGDVAAGGDRGRQPRAASGSPSCCRPTPTRRPCPTWWRPGRARSAGARGRAGPDQPGGAPARHPARRRRRASGGRTVTTARTVLTIAALTLREASRRRVLLALGVLTVLLLALSGWGFSKLAAESGGSALTSGEARLTASILLNLVMFGFSLIAALGTAFLAGPTLAGETESGIALAVLARPIRRSAFLLGKWLGLVTFGSGFVVLAGLAQCLVVRATVGLLATGPGDRTRAARGADGRAAHPRRPALDSDLADGVGCGRGRPVRHLLGGGRRGWRRRVTRQRLRGPRRRSVTDADAHRRPVARRDARVAGSVGLRHVRQPGRRRPSRSSARHR